MKKLLALIILILLAAGVYWKWDTIASYFQKDTLIIGLNTAATDLSPYGLDLNNNTRTANIYQGLVSVDKNLNVIPALAVSWGNIDPTTWEFRLREGVYFHDGSIFTPQDVIDSFLAAKASNNSQIMPYLSTIKEIKINQNGRLEVMTISPDPLLLSKLSKLYIYKENFVGTGPYQLKQPVSDQIIELETFPQYWGEKPSFSKLKYTVEPNWAKREADFLAKKIDLLGAVTPYLTGSLPEDQIKTGYGLEVNFLMFKLDDPLFKEKEMREVFQKLIDPQKIVAIGNGFVRPATQFVAQGVFGYNQNIKAYEYKPEQEPRDLFGIRLEKMELDYLSSYRTLVEYLSSQFQKAGFSVKATPLSPEALLDKVRQNTAQVYLMGWQAEDGDAGGFYDAFIHSQGVYNQGRYQNLDLDRMIEAARQEMNSQKRLGLLQEIGAKLQQDFIGIPLFETSRLYAVQKNIEWEPRLDGLILGVEVK